MASLRWWQRPRFPLFLPLFAVFLALFWSSAFAQELSQSQIKTLFRLQRMLEFPAAFSGMNNYTNPCYLPRSASLSIVCSGDRITELSIIGGGAAAPLSPHFNVDSFFTTLTGLPGLTVLSLVSLGLWGPLPAKIDRFQSLRVLNLSSNFLSGGIPFEISTMETLQSLVLAGNRFNGTPPDLRPLPALTELNLTNNRLGPELPLLPNSIVSVALKNNSFRAGIPPAMEFFDSLQSLDVSTNQLIGPIPPFLFSLRSIRSVDLSGNLLSGALPATVSCGGGLHFVDISRNRLSGNLPHCILANSSAMVVHYSGNCLLSGNTNLQHPVSYCSDGAIAAVMPTRRKTNQPNNRLGFILGIVGGIGAAAVVLGLVLIVIVKKSKTTSGEVSALLKPPAPEKAAPLGFPSDTRELLHSARLASAGVGSYRTFSVEEVEEATGNFSAGNLVSESKSLYKIYSGRLRDGSGVMIKCLWLKQRYSPQCLAQFIDTVMKLRHRHVVTVLGHCIADDPAADSRRCLYLVLEAVSNGNLRTHMTEWRKREMLKWPQRAAAAIGVAKGIQFLHSVGISGNDLSIENILLDETLAAKISDYNLPMATKNKNVKGGMESPFEGVEDGDLLHSGARRGEQGEKRDVYQLGLILLEIIIGSPVSNPIRVNATTNQLRDCLAEGPRRMGLVVDPSIQGTFAYDSLRAAAELALTCVAADASQRPSIDDVIWNLQYAVQLQEGWANSQSGPIQ